MLRRLSSLTITFLCLLFLASPVLADRQQDVDDMAPDAGANIAKFNLDSTTTAQTALGCTVLADGCVSGEQRVTDSGAIESTTKVIASVLTTPPVQTVTYVADVLQHFGVAQPVYAQGVGFAGLTPVLKAWKGFRDLAYFLFIIIFVVIGFMIMIRKKISNNAVVTIQEALPKIIVTLLLITFSYAIAGLVVDLMYLSIFVITGLFDQVGILDNPAATRNVLFGRNILQIGFKYLMGMKEVSGTGAETVGSLITQVMGGVIGTITSALAYLVIAVAIFIALFRTLLALITSYISIILAVIFAPITLLANAFPGSNSFGKWLLGLFANAAVFPAAVVMIILGVYLGGSYSPDSVTDLGLPPTTNESGFQFNGFLPPLISDGAFNKNSGGNATGAQGIIGLGFILLLPEVVKIVKEALQVKEPAYGEAAFKNAQAGVKPIAPIVNIPMGVGKAAFGGITGAVFQQGGNALAVKYNIQELFTNPRSYIANIRKKNNSLSDNSEAPLPDANSTHRTVLPSSDASGPVVPHKPSANSKLRRK